MYTITFSDNTKMIGKEPKDSNWLDIPEDKEIAKIDIKITHPILILEGYDEYCLQNELSTFLRTAKGFYSCITFLGRNKDKVEVFSFDLMSGKVFERITDYKKPYSAPIIHLNRKTNKWIFKGWSVPRVCVGWKKGKRFNFAPRLIKQNR